MLRSSTRRRMQEAYRSPLSLSLAVVSIPLAFPRVSLALTPDPLRRGTVLQPFNPLPPGRPACPPRKAASLSARDRHSGSIVTRRQKLSTKKLISRISIKNFPFFRKYFFVYERLIFRNHRNVFKFSRILLLIYKI